MCQLSLFSRRWPHSLSSACSPLFSSPDPFDFGEKDDGLVPMWEGIKRQGLQLIKRMKRKKKQ